MVSNFLKAARQEIRMELATLGEGQVYEFVPPKPVPPCFIISPGSPYVSQGPSFCDFTTKFEVVVLAGSATNETETDKLDDLITNAIDALETWFIEEVETPTTFDINNNLFLGAKLRITADKTL
jgi:hypothetical protein